MLAHVPENEWDIILSLNADWQTKYKTMHNNAGQHMPHSKSVVLTKVFLEFEG